jgi:hypothetical protein
MDMTWRLERPDAITTASHSEERPARSMVTISSALSSSSEMRMRFKSSVSGAALRATGLAAAGFLALALDLAGAGFFAGAFAFLVAAFLLAGFLPMDFLAAGFLTAFFFLAGLRGSSSS